jgi:hypothetical protein|tara:strand:+ start:4485 stop:4847 length:363 start_codon:yes stop_codon:yes gene_type:complete
MKRDAKIDLLAPDGLGADPVETGKGRVVQAPGATQAVKRAEPVIVSASRFDKEKHERDLATLLRCAARDPKLEQWAEAMTKKDQKRLTAASRAFHDDAHPCWSDGGDRSDLETVLAVLLV